jgi:hypothetical protein
MAADTDDPTYSIPQKTGDLDDVSDAGTPATGDTLRFNATDGEYKRVAHAAAITDEVVAAGANPTKAEYDSLVGKFNALLVAARAKGIIAP